MHNTPAFRYTPGRHGSGKAHYLAGHVQPRRVRGRSPQESSAGGRERRARAEEGPLRGSHRLVVHPSPGGALGHAGSLRGRLQHLEA